MLGHLLLTAYQSTCSYILGVPYPALSQEPQKITLQATGAGHNWHSVQELGEDIPGVFVSFCDRVLIYNSDWPHSLCVIQDVTHSGAGITAK